MPAADQASKAVQVVQEIPVANQVCRLRLGPAVWKALQRGKPVKLLLIDNLVCRLLKDNQLSRQANGKKPRRAKALAKLPANLVAILRPGVPKALVAVRVLLLVVLRLVCSRVRRWRIMLLLRLRRSLLARVPVVAGVSVLRRRSVVLAAALRAGRGLRLGSVVSGVVLVGRGLGLACRARV